MSKIRKLINKELGKLGAFSGDINKTALKMTNILDDEIPFKMKLSIANYIMSSFVNHFHVKIKLQDGTLVPANVINFVLATSGTKKTSSVNTLEASMSLGYEAIEEYRNKRMLKEAEEMAEAMDDDNVSKYIKKLNPLFNTISTEAGMIKRLNKFRDEGIGTPSLFVDEISTELETNPDIIPNIKLVSQLFDLGNMKSKALKDDANQSEEVYGMAMTCLFIGSEYGLLYDEKMLKKFIAEFVSKLARRSFFSYPEFIEIEKEAESIDDVLMLINKKKEDSSIFRKDINELSLEIAQRLIDSDLNIIEISTDASRLYEVYKLYCEEFSKDCLKEPTQLEFLHRHWKMLKLAGTYAVFNNNYEITTRDIIEAISVAELGANDLDRFMDYAKREHYEVMIDVLKTVDKLTYHDCSKHGWIKGNNNPHNKIQAMVELANSKIGKEGIVHHEDNIVYLERFKKDGMKASYKLVTGTKAERAYKVKDGFITQETSFEKLSKLLSNDTAYTPCVFKDGVRGNDNVVGGITFLVLDIDNSDITWEEAHDMLQDFNHHVAMTSNPDNPYKFRVLIETDITVDVELRLWKPFMEKVQEYIGFDIDILAYSQIYFGYKGREVLSTIDAELLPASCLIKEIDIPKPTYKRLPAKGKQEVMDDKFNVFSYAYEATGNTRVVYLYRVVRHAKDLGLNKEQVYSIVEDIMDYHSNIPEDIYKRTGLDKQIEKLYEGVVF